MSLRQSALFGIVAIGLASWSMLPVSTAAAAEGPAAVPVTDVLPVFGEPTVDATMAKVAKQTELAVVQYGKLRDLAAKTVKANSEALKEPLAKVESLKGQVADGEKLAAAQKELEAVKFAQRERLSWAIVEILYPDQVAVFQEAYEEQIGTPTGPARKMARARLKLIMGYEIPPLEGPQQAEVMLALLKYYGPVCKELSDLESAYKDRLADKSAAAEYQAKRDVIVKQTWVKSREIVNNLLPPEQAKVVAGEWLRMQNRRVDRFLRELSKKYTPKTDAQKKQVETIGEAFHVASRAMDMEDPAFGPLSEKVEKDIEAATKD